MPACMGGPSTLNDPVVYAKDREGPRDIGGIKYTVTLSPLGLGNRSSK